VVLTQVVLTQVVRSHMAQVVLTQVVLTQVVLTQVVLTQVVLTQVVRSHMAQVVRITPLALAPTTPTMALILPQTRMPLRRSVTIFPAANVSPNMMSASLRVRHSSSVSWIPLAPGILQRNNVPRRRTPVPN